MIQIYYGDGKGKTTAAVGTAVRAVGHGWRVAFVTFLKDGGSGEIAPLSALGVTCRWADERYELFQPLTESRRERLQKANDRLLAELAAADPAYDLVVLDEVLDALALSVLTPQRLMELLAQKNAGEWVLTGHTLPDALCERADYLSRVCAERHPYDREITAREGIEY